MTPARRSPLFPLLAAILAATLCVFINRHTLAYGFVSADDDQRVVFNAHWGGLSRGRLAWMFLGTGFNGYYMPLGWLSMSLLAGVAGLHPEPYHAALIGFHALNAVLAFVLIRRLLPALAPRLAAASGPAWTDACALLGSLWWSLNPLRVESTAWISGLSYAQAIALAFAAVIVHLGPAAGAPPAGGPSGRRLRPAAATALYAGSLLTYPIALGLAPVICVIDRHSGRRAPRAGFLIAAGVVLLLTLQGPRKTAEHFHLSDPPLPLSVKAARASYALSYYLVKPWVPVHLSLAYPVTLARAATPGHPVRHPFWSPALWTGIGATALIAGLCAASTRFRRAAGPFLVCHLCLLAPMTGLTANGDYITFDRYSTLACGLWAAGLALLLLRLPDRFRPAAAAALACGLCVLTGLSERQTAVWRDAGTLTANLSSHLAPDEFPDLQYNRPAFVLEMSGRYDEASNVVARGLAVFPDDPDLLSLQRSIAACRVGYARFCPFAELHVALADGYRKAGDWREADEHLRVALELSPAYAEAAFNRAIVRLNLGDYREALHDFLWAEARRAALPPPAPCLPALSPARRRGVLDCVAAEAEAAGDESLARAARNIRLR